MSHNMYYTKLSVPVGANVPETVFAYRQYCSDTRFYRVVKHERDNVWWYCVWVDGTQINSLAFSSHRNMSDSLLADMRALRFCPNESAWHFTRKVRGCKDA